MKSVKIIALIAAVSLNLYATNGDNMIGVGPTSKAMGGVGIAKAQDSMSAIFSNPATMTQVKGSEFNFTGTFFIPTVKADVSSTMTGAWKGESKDAGFAMPAIGLTKNINDNLVFGIGAYGVSGMGVDYRNKDPMNTNTKVSVMKFVPAVAFKKDNLSYGIGIDIDYQAADFGSGLSHNYSVGARVGLNYEYGKWNFGVVYVTPQNVTHERIYDFDNDGTYDDLKLENPAIYGAGFSYTFSDRLMAGVDIRYLDWKNADGYSDFDWDSQWVYALGFSYKANEKLTLRAGYNYGKNPVNLNNNFDPSNTATTNLQGNNMQTFGYEYFRVIGFPAIVEHHVTVGFGYNVMDDVSVNIGYMHAFKNDIREISSNNDVLKAELTEDAIDFGLTFKF